MIFSLLRFVVVVTLAALVASRAAAAPRRPIRVQPAADAIFAAFKTHPLVGLGDAHHMAQEGAFYAALVRDPRFASEVGNLVVEFGGAADQEIMDRYVNGETVSYEAMRRVLTDVVGWETPPSQMYTNLFATVRAVNAHLAPSKRIHVWLGEPPIDWTKVKSFDDLDPFMRQRDSYPASVIEKQILANRRKALVIYGHAHFFFSPMARSLTQLVEQDHPGAFFLIYPYMGLPTEACVKSFEAHTRGWRSGVVAEPVRGTWIAATLQRCHSMEGIRIADPERRRKANLGLSGALADALLYLGPAASMTQDPPDQGLYLDAAWLAEFNRRYACCFSPMPPIDPDAVLRDATAVPRPFQQP